MPNRACHKDGFSEGPKIFSVQSSLYFSTYVSIMSFFLLWRMIVPLRAVFSIFTISFRSFVKVPCLEVACLPALHLLYIDSKFHCLVGWIVWRLVCCCYLFSHLWPVTCLSERKLRTSIHKRGGKRYTWKRTWKRMCPSQFNLEAHTFQACRWTDGP